MKGFEELLLYLHVRVINQWVEEVGRLNQRESSMSQWRHRRIHSNASNTKQNEVSYCLYFMVFVQKLFFFTHKFDLFFTYMFCIRNYKAAAVCTSMEDRKTHNSNSIFLFYFYILISILIFLFYNCILISILSFQIPVLIFLFLLLYFDFSTKF